MSGVGYDFDNDQLGVFEDESYGLYEEDLGFEREDELLSALAVLFDDEFVTLAELIEGGNKVKMLQYFNTLYGNFMVVCEDEFSVDGGSYFELLLTDYELPATIELLGET